MTTSGTVVLVMSLATAFLMVVFRVSFRVVLAMVGPFIPALIYADSRWRGRLQSVIHYAYIISNEEYVRNPFQMFFKKKTRTKKASYLRNCLAANVRFRKSPAQACPSRRKKRKNFGKTKERTSGKQKKELRLGSSKFFEPPPMQPSHVYVDR